MHLEGDCTTHDTCACIVYIANGVEPTGRCGIHKRAPVKYSDVFFFYFLFYCDKNNLGS